MRPHIESALTVKKERIKANDAEIERINTVIKSLEYRRDGESDALAKKLIEQEITANAERRDGLVELNKIEAQIVLGLMK
jgi:hypothetical protein